MEFNLINSTIEIQGEQSKYMYEFSIVGADDYGNELIDTFLNSKYYREDCNISASQANKTNNNLFAGHAFDDKLINLEYFRKIKKVELIDFFNEYQSETNWGKDHADFVKIWNKFKQFIVHETVSEFYLISKEWFEKGDPILAEISMVYTYYFLIIWLDETTQKIKLVEWKYD
ncbi:MAG: hypothetical protein C5B52_05115 [Bacteroidetes bacterium]|nr:MAG: hypothetical protein C5B52_05115 [Bacteroidota bacterium]